MTASIASLLFAGLTALACSSSSVASPAPAADDTADAGATAEGDGEGAGEDVDAAPPPPAEDACGKVAKSKCSPANPGSVVRGIVTFDPAHYAGTKDVPELRIFLMHQFTLTDEEATQGGHPHGWVTVEKVDVASGKVGFTIDLCEFGTAMYSEENCGFNVVAVLDVDGSNDPDMAGRTAFIAEKGELIGMVPIDISCHAASPCLTIDASCADGASCTTFEAKKTCTCAATSCPSDDKICTK